MYYRICPICGAYLDPGESCDCEEKAEQATEEQAHRAEERASRLNQLRIDLERAKEEQARSTQAARRLKLEEMRADLLNTIKKTEKTA